jgi:hypothetical protein
MSVAPRAVRTDVSLVVVAVVFTGVGVAGAHVMGDADDGQSIDAQITAHLPDVRDYANVALPTAPPPTGAAIETSHYADSLHDGQVVMFQYRPFTVYVCAAVPGYTAHHACAATGGKTLLRTVHRHRIVTRYMVGTKSTAAAHAASPQLFDAINLYVSQARFTTTPQWLRTYAKAALRNRF